MTDRPSSRLVFASLVALTIGSGLIIAGVGANYATVVTAQEPVASPVGADSVPGGIEVRLTVENTYDTPLRIQFVHFELSNDKATASVSVPFNSGTTIPPAGGELASTISDRRLGGLLSDSDQIAVTGYIAVQVFQSHRVDVRIQQQEVSV